MGKTLSFNTEILAFDKHSSFHNFTMAFWKLDPAENQTALDLRINLCLSFPIIALLKISVILEVLSCDGEKGPQGVSVR